MVSPSQSPGSRNCLGRRDLKPLPLEFTVLAQMLSKQQNASDLRVSFLPTSNSFVRGHFRFFLSSVRDILWVRLLVCKVLDIIPEIKIHRGSWSWNQSCVTKNKWLEGRFILKELKATFFDAFFFFFLKALKKKKSLFCDWNKTQWLAWWC